jgi:ADP-ribose pyrophosphatase YjhB (NUDIX family)
MSAYRSTDRRQAGMTSRSSRHDFLNSCLPVTVLLLVCSVLAGISFTQPVNQSQCISRNFYSLHISRLFDAALPGSKGRDAYYIPGGKREPGESDVDTLVREISEELSVQIDPATAVHVGTFEAQAHGQPDGVLIRMTCYTARYYGTLAPANEIDSSGSQPPTPPESPRSTTWSSPTSKQPASSTPDPIQVSDSESARHPATLLHRPPGHRRLSSVGRASHS